MFLEPWMLGTLAITFGICAVWNYKKGMKTGAFSTLDMLENDRVIMIDNAGNIRPYAAPLKKFRKYKNKS